ncbi:MAG: phospholipase D-like domain-containing protein [Thermoproteus sp.]
MVRLERYLPGSWLVFLILCEVEAVVCRGPVEVVYEQLADYLRGLGVAGGVRSVLLASAFMRYDGVKTFVEALGGVQNGAELKVVFREATPKAYKYLRGLGFDVKMNERLHAKFYLVVFGEEYLALVGSSNLSIHGLERNREVNVAVRGRVDDPFYKCLRGVFDALWGEARAPTPDDMRRLVLRRRAKPKSFLAELDEELRELLGVEVDVGADRQSSIPVIYSGLKKFRARAEERGLVEEELVRRLIADIYGGPDELSRRLVNSCRKNADAYLLDAPCVLVYAAYEVVENLRRRGGGVLFETGIDFYKAALDRAKNTVEERGAGRKVQEYIRNEHSAVNNDKDYREQLVERKIGAVILPLILALPGSCKVDFEARGTRRVRKIVCT